MKHCLVVCLLFGAVLCLLEDIIVKVIADTDTDQDGYISSEELSAMILSFDDLHNPDGVVTKHEFTEEWIRRYNDNHPDTNTFFTNLDANGDHVLSDADLAIHMGGGLIDTNGDGLISEDEYAEFIRVMHPGHGNHQP